MQDPEKIGILTYCRDCRAVYTLNSVNCVECGSGSVIIFVASDTIRTWLEYETAYERMLESQCGCCDKVINECKA